MLNLRFLHNSQSVRMYSKKYGRLLLVTFLIISIVVLSLKFHPGDIKDNALSNEVQENTELEEENESAQPSKQLLSFNDILGQSSSNEENKPNDSTNKLNKDVLLLIESVNISNSHREQLKQCYIYFQSLDNNIVENFKYFKTSHETEKSEDYQTLAYLVRSYEHCKDLDYSSFRIDYENKETYEYLGENEESEMFKYKLVWNYILNTQFDFGFETKIYQFLTKGFINKSIKQWELSADEKEQKEKTIALSRTFHRLTDFENLQYNLKGANYLYEYNFDYDLNKEKQLSYMGKYLFFEIDITSLLNYKTALYEDFSSKFLDVEVNSKHKLDDNKSTAKESVGIIFTMGPRHINILPKYLAALNYHLKDNAENQNDYTLQIVFNNIEKEFNRNSDTKRTKNQIINQLLTPRFAPYLKDLKVSVLEVGNILNVNSENEDSFTFFINKWISLNFNQFNKFIFTDIDLTLFEHPDQMFSLTDKISKLHNGTSDLNNLFSKYKPLKTQKALPMVLLPDRALKERTFTQCTQLFKNMLPTTKQRYDFETFKSLSVPTLQQLYTINPIISKIFNNIFDIDLRKLHNIDSSLIIINNYNDVSSPLMFAFLLNFVGLDRCVYGDKEFLLLGMVFLGRFDFNVLGLNTGLIAGQGKEDYLACSTQSAQIFNGKLVSINGGLRKCKIDPVSYAIDQDLDFENKVNWLKEYYSISNFDLLKEEMAVDYMREVDIDILVEPKPEYDFVLSKDYMDVESENIFWIRSPFCMEYGYCLDLYNEKRDSRYLITPLAAETRAKYKSIVALWNAN